jgi:hypothetical protein
MPLSTRQLAVVLAVAACGLSGCGTINEKLADGLGDYVPQWLGGLPPDAPPRPGTAKYEEFMRERERKRLEAAAPAAPKEDAAKASTSSLDPVH